jgi:hypothetical protein
VALPLGILVEQGERANARTKQERTSQKASDDFQANLFHFLCFLMVKRYDLLGYKVTFSCKIKYYFPNDKQKQRKNV